jgi:hypothetical protein
MAEPVMLAGGVCLHRVRDSFAHEWVRAWRHHGGADTRPRATCSSVEALDGELVFDRRTE